MENLSDKQNDNILSLVKKAADSLLKNNESEFFEAVKNYFSQMPYPLHIPGTEKYYHILFYVFVSMLGPNIRCGVEEVTSMGRIDICIETSDIIYICELKHKQSAKADIKQIHNRKYAEKYAHKGKKIVLLGIAFDDKTRNISSWLKE